MALVPQQHRFKCLGVVNVSRALTWPFQISVCLLAVLLTACGGGGSGGNVNMGGGPPTVIELSVAEPGSAYAAVIIDCVEVEEKRDSCQLADLPLLAQDSSTPSVDAILAQTVISHDWMARRFRQYLNRAPAEILRLFGAVTAVVIAADIRPSQYSPYTGAIYLDPANLWTTNAEKATISRDPDYREDFGNDLNFVPLFRYVENNSFAWDFYPLSGTEERTLADLEPILSALLLHELAHANDFFPPTARMTLDPDLSVWKAVVALQPERASTQLPAALPLNSAMWMGLAEVLFRGASATAAQRAISPEQASLEFANDGANASYSYTTRFEDTAMLFEEVMMGYLYGIDREVLFTDPPPAGEEQYCDSYIIRAGYRERIGDVLVSSRAELVLQILLGQNDVSAYLENLNSPRVVPTGFNFCTVAPLNAPANASPALVLPAERQPMRPDSRPLYH